MIVNRKGGKIMKGKLAKFLRKLRLENDEYLKDMASKTGVSISFLSAVENETKKMTDSLLEKIIECYHLTKDQEEELRIASMEANKETTIYLDKLTDSQTKLTYRFARRIENIDDDTLSKIKKLLEENE